MLENCKTAKERWGGVSDIIDRWLKARQELIVNFCTITNAEKTPHPDVLVRQLQHFCQHLMDYLSLGHFEVYEQLIQEAKDFNDQNAMALAEKLIPTIEATTQLLVKFNDRFDVTEKSGPGLAILVDDLSSIGELLEERFELEDVMIQALHQVHAHHVA